MRVTRASGLTIVAPDTYRVDDSGDPAPGPVRRGGSAQPATTGRDWATRALLAAIDAQRLDLLDIVDLAPIPGTKVLGAARPSASQAVSGDQRAHIEVAVATGERAVLLAEQDGVYSWILPAPTRPTRAEPPAAGPGPVTRSAGGPASVIRFEIPLQATRPAGDADRRGQAADALSDRLTIHALTFAVTGPDGREPAASRGLVAVHGDDPGLWTLIAPADVHLPTDRPARILLFVHGVFSSTVGTFGALAAMAPGRAFLAAAGAEYDAVLGFDHATLPEDPTANATDLLRAIDRLDTRLPPRIDVVAFGRGGLVLRMLVEHLLPLSPGLCRIERGVVVACPNGGTALAAAEHWHTLADLYTNLAAGAFRLTTLLRSAAPALILKELVSGIGALVTHLAIDPTTDVRGLSAMRPDGDFVRTLDAGRPARPDPGATAYYAVTSELRPVIRAGDHRPRDLPLRLLTSIADGLVDRLIGGPNDLVVSTASMTALGPTIGARVRDTLAFGPSSHVHHLSYFTRPELVDALSGWLETPAPAHAAAPPPMPTPRDVQLPGAASRAVRPPAAAEAAAPVASAPTASGAAPSPPPDVPFAARPGAPLAPAARSVRRGMRRAAKPPSMGMATAGAEPPETPAAAAPQPALSTPADRIECHVLAEMDPEVILDATTTIEVSLSREMLTPLAGRASATSGPVMVDSAAKLLVQVMPRANFVLAAGTKDRVEVDPPLPGSPLLLYFDVTAAHAGPGEVWIIVRQHQMGVARLVLKPAIVQQPSAAPPGRLLAEADATTAPPLERPLDQLSIFEQTIGDTVRYLFELEMPSLNVLGLHPSPPLKVARDAYVSALYKEIETRYISTFDQASKSSDVAAFTAELQAYGAVLFDQLFPREIQDLLWTHRDAITSVRVVSTEPFIPWEIVHLREPGKALDPAAPPRFLGQMGLVRWLHNVNGLPPARLRLREGRARFVIPDYADPRLKLPATLQERLYLQKTFAATPIEPQPNPLRAALTQPGTFDLLHLACHGEADSNAITQARIALEGRDEGEIVPTYLNASTVESFARLRGDDGVQPIVFLNACQAGRAGYQLTGIGGFAQAFLRAGAGAFVGTLWSVGDQPAFFFGRAFYESLRQGASVSEAAIAAREAARRDDATWLAYVVYAHPHARLTVG